MPVTPKDKGQLATTLAALDDKEVGLTTRLVYEALCFANFKAEELILLGKLLHAHTSWEELSPAVKTPLCRATLAILDKLPEVLTIEEAKAEPTAEPASEPKAEPAIEPVATPASEPKAEVIDVEPVAEKKSKRGNQTT